MHYCKACIYILVSLITVAITGCHHYRSIEKLTEKNSFSNHQKKSCFLNTKENTISLKPSCINLINIKPIPNHAQLTEKNISTLELTKVLIEFNQRMDMINWVNNNSTKHINNRTLRRLIWNTLVTFNQKSIEEFNRFVSTQLKLEHVSVEKKLPITNGVIVNTHKKNIAMLKKIPTVARITVPENISMAVQNKSSKTTIEQTSNAWVARQTGINYLHRQGYTGKGVGVAIIDGGISLYHEQLSALASSQHFYDPQLQSQKLRDTALGHGSAILSLLAAKNTHHYTIGLSPQIDWYACLGLPKGKYQKLWVLSCINWVLQQQTIDLVVNAWVMPWACDTSLTYPLQVLWAAQILPIFSAGNYGPTMSSGRSPSDYANIDNRGRSVLSVGAIDREGRLLPSSGRGPRSCHNMTNKKHLNSTVYPTIVAPGQDLLVALPISRNAYSHVEGTSYATAIAAAGIALLKQKYQDASIQHLYDAIIHSAIDKGRVGADNNYGYGAINIQQSSLWLDKQGLK